MKVLVVDDEQLVRWFLDRALRKSGYEVVTVSNIAEAAETLKTDAIELLFLDLRMPEGSGVELIRQLDQSASRPKIIVCSAFITPELEDEFKAKGICMLKKPFKLEELNDTLKKCMEQ
ncbi:MAG: response regulator [Nitrospirae bacterium]|nr:response regulator [Nitrospirota bacterium]